MATKYARRKKLVDWGLQGTLMIRVMFYWGLCVLSTGLVLLAWQVAVAPPGPFWSMFRLDLLWIDYRAALIASLVVLPLILIDALLVSHRWAGPSSRLCRSMRALAAGQEVDLIRLRQNDFGKELAEAFNDVAIYVEKLKRHAQSPAGSQTTVDSEPEPAAVN